MARLGSVIPLARTQSHSLILNARENGKCNLSVYIGKRSRIGKHESVFDIPTVSVRVLTAKR